MQLAIVSQTITIAQVGVVASEDPACPPSIHSLLSKSFNILCYCKIRLRFFIVVQEIFLSFQGNSMRQTKLSCIKVEIEIWIENEIVTRLYLLVSITKFIYRRNKRVRT